MVMVCFPITASDGSNPGARRGDDGTSTYEPNNANPGPFSRANDVYMVYGIHLSYIFANNVKVSLNSNRYTLYKNIESPFQIY